jgi:hypothetical protein
MSQDLNQHTQIIEPSPLDPEAPPALIWEQREDGLFIQIPPAPREQMLAKPDRAVFRWFMAFAIFTFLAGFVYFTSEIPAGAALIILPILALLAGLVYREFIKRRAALRVAHLPTTIEISKGVFSVNAPHLPEAAAISVRVQRVRDLCACVSRFEGFGISPHGVHINTGYAVRLSLELDTNEAHDVMIKCSLNQAQTLQLETDLRNTLGLPPLKPP